MDPRNCSHRSGNGFSASGKEGWDRDPRYRNHFAGKVRIAGPEHGPKYRMYLQVGFPSPVQAYGGKKRSRHSKSRRLFGNGPNAGRIANEEALESYGAPERIRTSDLWFRRPTLYPAELQARGFSLSELGAFRNPACLVFTASPSRVRNVAAGL